MSQCHEWTTGWQRSLELQVIFRKRAPTYRSLLRKMTCKDKASYGFSPPCTNKSSHLSLAKIGKKRIFRGGTCITVIYLLPIVCATHCKTLQLTATRRNTLHDIATRDNTRQQTATHHSTLQHTATHLQHTAVHCTTLTSCSCVRPACQNRARCNTLQHTATHRNTPQHTATYYNTLRHTTTHCTSFVSCARRLCSACMPE